MFDRAPSSRRAKAWRPDPGLLSHHSRGFATTRWGAGDDGFMVDNINRTKDGFALDEYAQVPLSPQAVAALKRLQKMDPEEANEIDGVVFEAPEKFEVEAWNANAHLPFVVDDYGFEDDSVLAHDLVASAEAVGSTEVLTEPQAQAATAEDAAFNTDAAQSSPENEATDQEVDTLEADAGEAEADTVDGNEAALSEAALSEAEGSEAKSSETEITEAEVTEAEANVGKGVAAKVQAEVEADSQTLEEAKEEAKEDVQAQAQPELSLAATPAPHTVESEPTVEQAVAPEQTAAPMDDAMHDVVDAEVNDVTQPEPVHAGIDPDGVAHREAEMAEKFAEGLAKGMEKGLAQGVAQGESQAREAMQQEVQAQCTLLANVTQKLQVLLQDSKAFYEPMKRLALHVAEQIVMAELRTSTQAIEQLIQRCLDALDHPVQGLVVLELNPDDKARLQAQSPELIRGMRLEAVHDMAPGSVRLFANDAVVEDLVTHRLQALAQSMLVDVAAWQAHSALAKPAAAAHDMESDDVHP